MPGVGSRRFYGIARMLFTNLQNRTAFAKPTNVLITPSNKIKIQHPKTGYTQILTKVSIALMLHKACDRTLAKRAWDCDRARHLPDVGLWQKRCLADDSDNDGDNCEDGSVGGSPGRCECPRLEPHYAHDRACPRLLLLHHAPVLYQMWGSDCIVIEMCYTRTLGLHSTYCIR